MSRVFMDFAASGEILFKARCGAKDFLDKLTRALFGARVFAPDEFLRKSGTLRRKNASI